MAQDRKRPTRTRSERARIGSHTWGQRGSSVSESQLAGNGVDLVRERALARSVQRALERLYQIEDGPDVHAFVQLAPEGERESLRLRQGEDGVLEVALHLPSFVRDRAAHH